MVRCHNCGARNNETILNCSVCGCQLPGSIEHEPEMIAVQNEQSSVTVSEGNSTRQPFAEPTITPPPHSSHRVRTPPPPSQPQQTNQPHLQQSSLQFNTPPQLEGIVISIDSEFAELPDTDWLKTIVKILIWLPLLPALLVLGVIFNALRINVFQGLIPFIRGRGQSGNNSVPVQYFRVRDDSGNELQIKRKGYLASGNIQPGDRVAIWGRWVAGTLNLSQAFNLRTNTSVVLQGAGYRWIHIIMLIVMILLIISFFASFIR